jgi:hypothetical protein
VPEGRGGGAGRGAAPGGASGGAAAPTPVEPNAELYNLDEDPSEKFNLASSHPAIVAELRRLADEHVKSVVRGASQLGRGGAAGARGAGGRGATAPGGGPAQPN